MASKKRVEVDIVTEASGNGAQTTAAGISKVGDAAAKTNAQIGKNLEGAVQNLPVVGQAYGALVNPINAAGVATAGLSALFAHKAQESIELADLLKDLSGQFGVAATSIQRIGNVAKDEGGGFAEVAGGLNFLTKSSQEAIQKGGDMEAAYARLGLTLDDLKGKNSEEIFMALADEVATATDRQRTYNDVLTVAGRSAGSLYATLEKGSEQIKALGEAKGIFDEDDIETLANAKDQLEKLNNQLTIFSGKIVASGLEVGGAVQEFGALETAVLALQGALSQVSGGKINVDLTGPTESIKGWETPLAAAVNLFGMAQNAIAGTEDAAAQAAPAVQNVVDAAAKIYAAPAANLAKSIEPVKAAAEQAATAVRDLNAATSELGSAQDRLSKAQFENARAQIDLQLELGNITKEQAINAKANVANDERAAKVAGERAKVLAAVADAEADLAAASSAGNTEAVDASEERLAILRQTLTELEAINTLEADTGSAEYQKQIADLRSKTEKEITTEKEKQLVATEGAVAAEAAITAAQNGRESAPLQQSPIGPSGLDPAVDLTKPVQPRDLTDELKPRNPPQPPPQPQDPNQGPGNQPDGQATAALEKAIAAMKAELAAVTTATENMATEIPASIVELGKPIATLPASVEAATGAIVAMFTSLQASITALETRVNNLRA